MFQIPETLTDLPRIGLSCDLAEGFDRVEWFGRGPEENYIDRREGYPLGRYRSTVDGMREEYVMPQACGNRCDVREVTLSGRPHLPERFAVVFENPGEFSVSRFSDSEIWRARHLCDLRPDDVVHLYLDARQRGVGTNSCGSELDERYRTTAGSYRLNLILNF